MIDALDDVVNGLWSFGSGDEREKEYEDNLAIFKDSMRQIVVEHRKQKSSGDYQKAPFLDMLIDNIDDEDEIVHQAITFIIGGFHTTGNYLTWFFYNLGCFQDIQTRVVDEVASKSIDKHPTRNWRVNIIDSLHCTHPLRLLHACNMTK